MYDNYASQAHTIQAYDKILSDLQVQQSERDRMNAYLQLQLQCTNVFNPLQRCKEDVEEVISLPRIAREKMKYI